MNTNTIIQSVMMCAVGFGLLHSIVKSGSLGWYVVAILCAFCVAAVVIIYLLRYEPARAVSIYGVPGFHQLIDAVCAVSGEQRPSGAANTAKSTGDTSARPQDGTAVKEDGIAPKSAAEFDAIVTSMSQFVIGHDASIKTIVSHIERAVLLRRRRERAEAARPLAVLLLIGPDGIGKRFMATQLAAHLHTKPCILPLRGPDYSDAASAFPALFGGQGQPGALLSSIRSHPQNIIYVDAFEALPPKVLLHLRDLIRAGYAIDEAGRRASLQDTVFVFATSRGQAMVDAALRKNSSPEETSAGLAEAIGQDSTVPAEFFGIVTDYIRMTPPKLEDRALVLMHIASGICAEYGVQLEYVSPDILVAEVVSLPASPMFEAVPDRLRRLLSPLLADLAKRERRRLIWQREHDPVPARGQQMMDQQSRRRP